MKKIYTSLHILLCLLATGLSQFSHAQKDVFPFLPVQEKSTNNPPIIRLIMDGANSNDETVFYFQQGGTTAFQSDYDAYKLLFNAGTQPYVASLSGTVLTSISGLPELPVNLNIPVKAFSPSNGSYTFSAEQTDFPDNVCVTLYDAFTGISTNILNTNYVCNLYDTTNCARFTMNFYTNSLEANSLVAQNTCQSSDKASIRVSATNNGPWNYVWTQGGEVIKTVLQKSGADTLANLSPGVYTLKMNTAGQCDLFTSTFNIDSVYHSYADFASESFSTSLSHAGAIQFINTSSNSAINHWEFGDNIGTSSLCDPSYNYIAAGTYSVRLITESKSHCKDTALRTVVVVDDVTGISTLEKDEKIHVSSISPNLFALHLVFNSEKSVHIALFNINGLLLKESVLQNAHNHIETLDLSAYANGLYLLRVKSNDGFEKTFRLLN